MMSEKSLSAVTSFVAKYQLAWVVGTVCIGILFVLLPALSSGWRNAIAEWPGIRFAHEFLPHVKILASIYFAASAIPLSVVALFGHHAYPGWNVKANGSPTRSMILQKELYPKNWRGLAAFYSFLAIDIFGLTMPLFLICWISYVVRP